MEITKNHKIAAAVVVILILLYFAYCKYVKKEDGPSKKEGNLPNKNQGGQKDLMPTILPADNTEDVPPIFVKSPDNKTYANKDEITIDTSDQNATAQSLFLSNKNQEVATSSKSNSNHLSVSNREAGKPYLKVKTA